MERRSSERIKVIFPIRAKYREVENIGGDVVDWEGEIVDISDRGACIISHKYLKVNSEIDLGVITSTNSDISRKIENLKISAQIVWMEMTLNETYQHRYGVKFLGSPNNRHLLILKEILSFEQERLSKRLWETSHPDFIFPTLPLSSKILDNLSPTALSVDITNLCNLKCKHCFWHSYKGGLPTRTNKNILNSVRKVLNKFPSITNITWYGGEPLINKETRELLRKGIIFRKNNLVITNGVFPIPDWCVNVHFGVSIDGTEEIHNKLRGFKIYKKIKRNIYSAIARRIPVGILYCMNAINIDCIPDFVREWSEIGLIEMVFTVYSPMRRKPSFLTLSNTQRDKVVSILLKMKKKYGKLISNTETMIELIRAKYGEELAKNCPMNIFNKCGKIYSIHMCNDGSIRIPCALGRDVSHLHCRSVTKVALYAGKALHDKESFLALFKMYHSKPHHKNIASLTPNTDLISI